MDIRFCFIWHIFLILFIPDKSLVLQFIICFVSFRSFLTWIIAANPFGVIRYFVFAAIIHMLGLNLMNYFASVRYYDLRCTAGVSEKEVLQREPWKPVDDIWIFGYGFLGWQLLGKYRIFHFGQVLMRQKKFQGILQGQHVISRHISRYTFKIYIVL